MYSSELFQKAKDKISHIGENLLDKVLDPKMISRTKTSNTPNLNKEQQYSSSTPRTVTNPNSRITTSPNQKKQFRN
ncbi:hypothetical protein [Candidatus Phytoplasma melaleucae]|uniref:Uncharacterized protein n=1 Tax=Candidatus Phytoplasma melaleucae TaxID=2982630 RepID=A0ABT9DFB8_9MOLU|nr:hypothetical protein ['Melaleuca sp.' phytoplasma]MDO8168069.1 hypothetical protein ['Melaleuca sp.' phytoplasma]MDV3205350.1 hypothetical protein [Weeping tea tree witches'-broom phytoplasma]